MASRALGVWIEWFATSICSFGRGTPQDNNTSSNIGSAGRRICTAKSVSLEKYLSLAPPGRLGDLVHRSVFRSARQGSGGDIAGHRFRFLPREKSA